MEHVEEILTDHLYKKLQRMGHYLGDWEITVKYTGVDFINKKKTNDKYKEMRVYRSTEEYVRPVKNCNVCNNPLEEIGMHKGYYCKTCRKFA